MSFDLIYHVGLADWQRFDLERALSDGNKHVYIDPDGNWHYSGYRSRECGDILGEVPLLPWLEQLIGHK